MFAGKDGPFSGYRGERGGLPTSRDARIARTPRSELSWESLARERARHPSSSRLSGSRVASRRKPGRFRNLEQRPWTGRASAHEHQRHSGDCGPARRREGRGWRKWGFRQRVGRQEVRVDARNAREATRYDPTDACRDGFFPHSLSDGIPFRSSPLQAAERADVSHGAYRARAPLFSRRRGEPTRLGVPEPRGPSLPRPATAPSVFFQVFGTVVEPSSFPLSSNAQTKADAGISAFPDGDNIFNWVGTIEGAAGTVRHPSDPLGHPRISSPPNPSFARKPRHREPTRSSRPRNFSFLSRLDPTPHPPSPHRSRRCTRGSRTS